MDAQTDPEILTGRRMPAFGEFVGLVALMMGFTAFAVDNLLPAFPAIGSELAVADGNNLQLLVYVYMAGFGIAQLAYGPISDAVGRRPVLMVGLAVFAVGCVLAIVAHSLPALLVARFIQGSGAAAGRVLAVAVVRDRFAGREMARVMSLSITVFIMIPVIAPTLGSGLLLLGGWRIIFGAMLVLAVVLAIWFGLRMPETLRPEYRQRLSVPGVGRAIGRTVTTRATIGYSTAFGLSFSCIMAYVGSAQQIFGPDIYDLGRLFPAAFGAVAATMGVAALLNSRLVTRFGMRRISQVGIGLFLVLSCAQLAGALAFRGHPPLALFGILLAGTLFLVMLLMPNLNTMAMEPLGSIAGTASSFIGFYTTVLGALLGGFVGHAFNGTILPLAIGFTLLSAAAVLTLLWTEGAVPFKPTAA